MSVANVLIAGKWQPSLDAADSFAALNPATGETLDERYPISGMKDVEAACRAGACPSPAGRTQPI